MVSFFQIELDESKSAKIWIRDEPFTMTVNVHPDMVTLNQALLDFIDVFRWRNVAILYKGTEGRFTTSKY